MNEHWLFVGAGYGIAWAALIWYVLRLRTRERAASERSGGGDFGGGTG
ncbi:hypothetical protein [Candidatus Palauibacter sp.]